MGHEAALIDVAGVLLAEELPEGVAGRLLERVVEEMGAESGFIVVRDGDDFVEKASVRFDLSGLSSRDRQFSRSLVRQAIDAGDVVYVSSLLDDERFAAAESARSLGPCCVVVAPLRSAKQTYGVLYLENRKQLDSFSASHREFLRRLSQLAGSGIKRALEREELRRRAASLERDLLARHEFPGIVTSDRAMLGLLRTVAQVANAEATVLLLGETGTGKELIAHALHVNSSRRSRPFAVVHCGALPPGVFESELFGHVKGAFTGATQSRGGRIASARDGTLFLDEVGEIPLELQGKLLRFLESGEIQRVGSDGQEKVDARVVAATHRDLKAMIAKGQFREDLYYRLRVVELTIPPLRDRRGDIPLLAEHFLGLYWKSEAPKPRWTGAAWDALLAHDYPGNVRELAHAIERAALLCVDGELDLESLPSEFGGDADGDVPAGDSSSGLDQLKREREAARRDVDVAFLSRLLTRCGGNVSRAARESGIRRSYLQKLIAKYDIPRHGS